MGDDQRCGACVFWGKPGEPDDFKTCTAIVHDKHRASVSGSDDDYDPDEVEERTAFRAEHLAVVLDGSGYLGSLRTRDDFGCRLWQPKEAP